MDMVRCREYGDAGILVDILADDSAQRWVTAHSLGAALRCRPPIGFVDVVASFENVFVSFDPLATDHTAVRAAIVAAIEDPPTPQEPRRFIVPVVYGGDYGPDLESVATAMGLRPDGVVHLHLAGQWVVRFVGSPVGAPMMDGPRLPCGVPRLPVPRVRVEPGSVAISGFQSMIYNAPSPGGWRIIGRSPALLFDLKRSPSVIYQPGDTFSFRHIDPEDWNEWRRPLEISESVRGVP